jgi:hypothetical protein
MSRSTPLPLNLTVLLASVTILRSPGHWETVRNGYLVEFGLVISGTHDSAILDKLADEAKRMFAENRHSMRGIKPLTDAEIAAVRALPGDQSTITWRSREILDGYSAIN